MGKKQVCANGHSRGKAVGNNFNGREVGNFDAIGYQPKACGQNQNACGKRGNVFADDNRLPNVNHQMQREGDERAQPQQVECSYASECQTADNQQQNKLLGNGKRKACGGCDVFENERESREPTAHSGAVADQPHPHSDNLFEIMKNKQQR